MYYLNKIPSTDTFKFLLPVFIFINFTLYYFSYEGAFFIEGADASQYYKPALSLIEGNGKFLIGESQPLTFGPPLYSIFLAISIGVFGFDNSVEIIIILQLLILFFTGYIFNIIFLNLMILLMKNTLKFVHLTKFQLKNSL